MDIFVLSVSPVDARTAHMHCPPQFSVIHFIYTDGFRSVQSPKKLGKSDPTFNPFLGLCGRICRNWYEWDRITSQSNRFIDMSVMLWSYSFSLLPFSIFELC